MNQVLGQMSRLQQVISKTYPLFSLTLCLFGSWLTLLKECLWLKVKVLGQGQSKSLYLLVVYCFSPLSNLEGSFFGVKCNGPLQVQFIKKSFHFNVLFNKEAVFSLMVLMLIMIFTELLMIYLKNTLYNDW